MMRTATTDVRPPCYKIGSQTFGVPAFYPQNHRETFIIVKMIKESNWNALKVRMRTNPDLFRQSYYQLPDVPPSGDPVFHNKAIFYLTVAGLTAYFGSGSLLKQILTCNEPRISECEVDVNEPCFVTNVKEKLSSITDVHAIYPFCIAIRRSQWKVLPALLEGGWIPHESFKLPYRKLCCAFNLTYADAFDYFLGQMVNRPSLDLAQFLRVLIQSYHENFVLRTCLMQQKCIDGNIIMHDLLSLPRRLLRFMYEQDVNFRLGSRILHGIQAFVREYFFEGPTNHSAEISLENRLNIYKEGLKEDNYYTRTIYDQDCCIALILGYVTKTNARRFLEINKKAIKLLIQVLAQTRWLLRFLNVALVTLSNYFLSIGENVEISVNMIRLVRAMIPDAYRSGQIQNRHIDPDIIDLEGDVVGSMQQMIANAQEIEDENAVNEALRQTYYQRGEESSHDDSMSNGPVKLPPGYLISRDHPPPSLRDTEILLDDDYDIIAPNHMSEYRNNNECDHQMTTSQRNLPTCVTLEECNIPTCDNFEGMFESRSPNARSNSNCEVIRRQSVVQDHFKPKPTLDGDFDSRNPGADGAMDTGSASLAKSSTKREGTPHTNGSALVDAKTAINACASSDTGSNRPEGSPNAKPSLRTEGLPPDATGSVRSNGKAESMNCNKPMDRTDTRSSLRPEGISEAKNSSWPMDRTDTRSSLRPEGISEAKNSSLPMDRTDTRSSLRPEGISSEVKNSSLPMDRTDTRSSLRPEGISSEIKNSSLPMDRTDTRSSLRPEGISEARSGDRSMNSRIMSNSRSFGTSNTKNSMKTKGKSESKIEVLSQEAINNRNSILKLLSSSNLFNAKSDITAATKNSIQALKTAHSKPSNRQERTAGDQPLPGHKIKSILSTFSTRNIRPEAVSDTGCSIKSLSPMTRLDGSPRPQAACSRDTRGNTKSMCASGAGNSGRPEGVSDTGYSIKSLAASETGNSTRHEGTLMCGPSDNTRAPSVSGKGDKSRTTRSRSTQNH